MCTTARHRNRRQTQKIHTHKQQTTTRTSFEGAPENNIVHKFLIKEKNYNKTTTTTTAEQQEKEITKINRR